MKLVLFSCTFKITKNQIMDTLQQLKSELTQEYDTTRKFLEEYPEDKNDYKPHPKSMDLSHLTSHIIEIFGWPGFMFNTSELDLAKGDHKPTIITTKTQALEELQKNYEQSIKALEAATEADLEPKWRLAMNGQTLAEWTKYEAIRHALSQITHHRAQLGVYYRLNDISLPGSYGPSADVQNF